MKLNFNQTLTNFQSIPWHQVSQWRRHKASLVAILRPRPRIGDLDHHNTSSLLMITILVGMTMCEVSRCNDDERLLSAPTIWLYCPRWNGVSERMIAHNLRDNNPRSARWLWVNSDIPTPCNFKFALRSERKSTHRSNHQQLAHGLGFGNCYNVSWSGMYRRLRLRQGVSACLALWNSDSEAQWEVRRLCR